MMTRLDISSNTTRDTQQFLEIFEHLYQYIYCFSVWLNILSCCLFDGLIDEHSENMSKCTHIAWTIFCTT